MGGNGLIFAFVVVLWAAYFVPLALRRYDEAARAGSIERFSALARVVRRSDEESGSGAETTAMAREERAEEAAQPPRPRLSREAARTAARRRRNTLCVLLLGVIGTATTAGLGYAPWWSLAVSGGLVVAWLIACRIMVRSELGLGRASRRGERKPAKKRLSVPGPERRRHEDDEETVVLSHQFEDVEPHRKHVMESAELPSDALDEKLQIAVPVASMTGEVLWDPLPVTLPTYVTKPRVGRTVRTIDFDEPGTWTSGHIEGVDEDFPTATPAEAPLKSERAVGE